MADLPDSGQRPHALLWGDVLAVPPSALLSSTSDNDGSFWCPRGPPWATLEMFLASNAGLCNIVLGETGDSDGCIPFSRASTGALMGPLPSCLAGSGSRQEALLAVPLLLALSQ